MKYKDTYTSLIKDYKKDGNNLCWTMEDGVYIRIKHMNDEYLNGAINTLNVIKRKHINGTIKAWTFILNDELIKRRLTKINKITNRNV